MVVISAGIRPNAELAKRVWHRLRQSDCRGRPTPHGNDPAVFGVGECVQHNGMIYGSGRASVEQTRVLAKVLELAPMRSGDLPGSKIATS